MNNPVSWWTREFSDFTFEGHLRNRTFEADARSMVLMDEQPDTETLRDSLDDEGQLTIRGPKSLMKHVLTKRALVISLVVKASRGNLENRNQTTRPSGIEDDVKGEGKAKAKPDSGTFTGEGQRLDGQTVPEKSEKAKGKEKAQPKIKLRKIWTEVFSRPDGRWFPVDPVAGHLQQQHPTTPHARSAAPLSDPATLPPLPHTVAHTARTYTIRLSVSVFIMALALGGGVPLGFRAYAEARSAVEAPPYGLDRMCGTSMMSRMQRSTQGDAHHDVGSGPSCIRSRAPSHLDADDSPAAAANERAWQVQRRAGNWMRGEGRQIKAGEQSLRWGKMKASTIGRMRQMQAMREGLRDRADAAGIGGLGAKKIGEEEVMQGLYALSQTELYIPDPIVDVSAHSLSLSVSM
ncbi:hypothetical protein R3P38DRAFT_2766519 [Favolaschia claudopus]|uniref:Rad4 beta-hairpin domain-containing protein n=1 Tax=Favolaschia claudopus TaxID=2862362 RepID=A0AAW0D145_9AGAR